MRIIRHYTTQSIDVENWLINKGYKKNRGGYSNFGEVKAGGRYYTLWHVYNGKDAFIVAEERAGSFDIIVIYLDDIVTVRSVRHFLETGESVKLDLFGNFI